MGILLTSVVLKIEDATANRTVSDNDDVEVFIVPPPSSEVITTTGAHGNVNNDVHLYCCITHDWRVMTNEGTWMLPNPDTTLIQRAYKKWSDFPFNNNATAD